MNNRLSHIVILLYLCAPMKHSAKPALSILFALSAAHLLNDLLQSVVSASYPVFRDNLGLNFAQIGLVTLVYQICSSVFQPLFGIAFDRRPRLWYLNAGSSATLLGLVVLGFSASMGQMMIGVALVGLGSSVIHPETSKLTHRASGGRHGLAQSIFQVGGNLGGSLGPLLAAVVIAAHGQRWMAAFALFSLAALINNRRIARWYGRWLARGKARAERAAAPRVRLSKRGIYWSVTILLILTFSKYVYLASFSNYLTFYLIEKFGVTTQQSQLYLFAFLFGSAVGTLLGGPIGDRVGRRWVIWGSVLGVIPFALLLPYANLLWTCVLSVSVAFVLSSAFPAILVYTQELLPRHVGSVSGLFFGFAFGVAGIAAAVMGLLADAHGIEWVYRIVALTPLLGLMAVFLPRPKRF